MDDLITKTDDELEAIIRRAENTHISGSLFQRAKIELDLRDRKRKNGVPDGGVGILNKGENGVFIRNKFKGLRVGIQDEGKNTLAAENEFINHRTVGEKWHQRWWGQLMLGLVVAIVAGIVLTLF